MTKFGRGRFYEDLMFAGMRMSTAWKMLHRPEVTKNLDAEAYMDLCRDAGYSEEQVQDAGNRWANLRLDRGLSP